MKCRSSFEDTVYNFDLVVEKRYKNMTLSNKHKESSVSQAMLCRCYNGMNQ